MTSDQLLTEMDQEHAHIANLITSITDRVGYINVLHYFMLHFIHEESVMIALEYPGLEEHRIEHSQMLRDAWDIHLEANIDKLVAWAALTVTDHIDKIDGKLVEYIKQHL